MGGSSRPDPSPNLGGPGSGSLGGNGSGGGSGGGGGGPSDECSFAFETDVFGPVATVAATLAIGSPVTIMLVGASVGVFAVSAAMSQLGTVAGSNYIPRLVSCLQKGVTFHGDVIAINGSQIRIRISS